MLTTTIATRFTKMPADLFTPVGIYLRLRDQFRDSVLLESNDFHGGENSFSFIGIKAIAGVEISSLPKAEYRLPGQETKSREFVRTGEAAAFLQEFLSAFKVTNPQPFPVSAAQGLFGYTSYDAVQLFESISFNTNKPGTAGIPFIRYRLYQYVIAIDHFRDELYLIENMVPGMESERALVETLIRSRDVPLFPFTASGTESSNLTDDAYKAAVKKGIDHCHRGDVFQVVMSREYRRPFSGDEFNVYRALRSVNPGPYLFYFDYGNYRLMGSSPESQLIVKNGEAVIHPIAGTVKRTGNDAEDQRLAQQLMADPKENAEHVMLVDLARNDLSRFCTGVSVHHYKELKYYSHVIHLVSEVKGRVQEGVNIFGMMGGSFPAGTLSGAPKHRAMQIIDEAEPTARGFYGGAIGLLGFDGSCNHAIMIRSLLSINNELVLRAGAGVVAASKPENELEEVNNKLGAMRAAIHKASEM